MIKIILKLNYKFNVKEYKKWMCTKNKGKNSMIRVIFDSGSFSDKKSGFKKFHQKVSSWTDP